jgi:3-ketosteroid 9alpha-monooxygenase subunit B
VKRVVQETAACRSFEFEVEGPWAARAGEHCSIAVEIDGIRHVRCYSLSSVMSLGELPRLTVKRLRGGLVSNWCNDRLAPGSSVDISLPSGQFVIPDGATPLLFLAAGSGITPIFAMLRQALAQHGRSATLLYINHAPADAIFARDLNELARAFPDRFILRNAFTGGGHSVPRRVLPGALSSVFTAAREAEVYLCGPAGFMRACREAAGESGIPEARIISESFVPAAREPSAENVLTVFRLQHDGTTVPIACPQGATLLHALQRSGETPAGICGGQASCGTCRVSVVAPWAQVLAPAGRAERRLLEVLPSPNAAHRLACQISLARDHCGLVFAPAPLTTQQGASIK